MGSPKARIITTRERRQVREQCAAEWAQNYQMRNFCEVGQIEALRALGREPGR